MKATTLVPAAVSVEEYLRTAFRPDCDYVDGEVIERNLGEHPHSDLQSEFLHYFRSRRKQWKMHAVVEQRVQVSSTRFRIPDVCVVAAGIPHSPIYKDPPLICIEILSPDDRQNRVQQRVDNYLKFGVRYVWVVDPQSRRAWVYTTNGSVEVKDGILRTEDPVLIVNLVDIFAELES
jgi:Uma2 family endonuclease